MTSSDPDGVPPDPAAEEVVRLREEVDRLRRAAASRDRGGRRGRWRPVVAGLLVALAALLAPLSILSTWANGQVRDTDRYVATVAPLASDPDVQQAIVMRVEQVVYRYLDPDATVAEVVVALEARGLPEAAVPSLSALAGPLATGIRSFLHDRIVALVRSDAFERAWVEANRTAHSELAAALTGETEGIVEIDDGAVTVDLAPLVGALKQQLVDAGFGIADRIPDGAAASFTIVHSDDLATVQDLLGLLSGLSTWLPVVVLALVAGAVLVAHDRRQTILVAGLAMAGSMLLLGAVLDLLRPVYLEALPASSSAAAAGAVYDQLVSFIRLALRGLLVVAVAVVVVTWFGAGRGPGATARRTLVQGISRLRSGGARAGLRTGRRGVLLREFRGPVRAVVVGVAAGAYLAQDHPTGGTALAFVVLTALVACVLEVLAATPGTGT